MYTIKHASEVTGLTPATLRAWERRYGVVTPQRTDAGYRLYDEQSFRALTLMAALVAQGWSPRQAADETRRRIGNSEVVTPSGAPGVGVEGAAGTPVGVPSTESEDFLDAAVRLDVVRLGAILDDRFSSASFESVVDGWLMPTLVMLGDAWAKHRMSVASEHLASYAVTRRLAAAYDASSAGATGPSVVVGLPQDARHELGVLAFAVAARRAGLKAVYLGADLPAADWVTAVTMNHPRAVVLAARQTNDLQTLGVLVDRLHAADPALLIAVGGGLQDQAPDGCLRLGHRIGAGAARLAEALATTHRPEITPLSGLDTA
jgi:methanogenic corrinoid protein MtbC1